MRASVRPHPFLLILTCVLVLTGALLAFGAAPASAATTWLPPALYVGSDAALSGTAKITSPLVSGQPSAALYVKGRLANSSSANLSTIRQVIGAKGATVPGLSQFMPASRIADLTAASQAAKPEGRVYPGLVISGTKDQTFKGPITVNGSLAISGSGTYTFDSVYVTGSVAITNPSAKFSFGALRVGGSLSVSGGTARKWGPTYVAGSVSLSGKEQWNMSLLVTGGSLAISGTQSIGGDGVDGHAKPVTMLLISQGKAMSYSSTGSFYGLLCTVSGSFAQSGTGYVKGSVICGGAGAISGSASIAYDPNVGKLALDVASPQVTISSPLDGSVLDTRSPLLRFTVTDAQDGSGVDQGRGAVTLDGVATTWPQGGAPPQPLTDGPHTVVVTGYDLAGNKGSATSTFTVRSDTTPPATTASASPAPNASGWNTGDVTTTLNPTDNAGGSGVKVTYWKIDVGATQTYSPANKPVLTSTTQTLRYWSQDNAGNLETERTLSVRIDKVAPAATAAPSGEAGLNGWFRSDVAVTLTPFVGASGVALVEYRLDSGVWTPLLASAGTYLLNVSTEGQHTVACRATNGAGITGVESNCSFAIDRTAPAVTLIARNGSSTGFNRPVFDFEATDAGGSGLIGAPVVKLDDQIVAAESGIPLPERLANGTHTLTVTAVDGAGHQTVETVTFTVDQVPFTVQHPQPSEGDVIGLYAPSAGDTANEDGSWEGKTWEWSITGSDSERFLYDGPVRFVALPTTGDYQVRLTITDDATGAVSVTDQDVSAEARQPRVHALDVEAVDGQPARLVGRFLDPGWTQTHTATWAIEGVGQVAGVVSEDNLAVMDSGAVTGVTAALHGTGILAGTLTVTDSTGASTEDSFTITVRARGDDSEEGNVGNDVFANATTLPGGRAHLAYVSSAGDVDLFEVLTPEGESLPYGTEVLATLRDLPADYDLAVIQDLGRDADPAAALGGSSFASSALIKHSGWEDLALIKHSEWEALPLYKHSALIKHSPYLDSALIKHSPLITHSPWEIFALIKHSEWDEGALIKHSPAMTMLFTHTDPSTGNSLDGYSFLEMSFTGLGADTAAGNDMGFEELGFDNEAVAGMRVAGFSAHVGTEAEVVQATTDFTGGHTYIAVKGANGAFSDQPYTVQVETSVSLHSPAVMNAETPAQPVVVSSAEQTSVSVQKVAPPPGAGPLTLFVTQAERVDALYSDPARPGYRAFDDTVLPALRDACASDLVRGEVISVPSVDYNKWDETPWSTTLANDATVAVRDEIQRYLNGHPTIRYVVLVGSDEVVPQRRVPDQTIVGNEAAYASSSGLFKTSPLLAAMLDRTVLSDDFYVDAQPIPYNGRWLYAPDIAVARLVETPDEIAGVIERFLSSDGRLAGSSSVVTGQDFMANGAERVRDILAAAELSPKLEPLDVWTAADVRKDLLGATTDAGAAADVGDVNAHFTHYGGISAAGYALYRNRQDWSDEFLTSTEIAGAPPTFLGKLVFSMGCHAGLSVPDRQVESVAEDVDMRLDVAQAVARKQGVLVASTGFGFGDTEAIAGTEALIGTFADQATTADEASGAVPETGQPIGLALAAAKRQYLGSLSSVTPYDEKSSIQFTMYGMPQYRLACTTHPPVDGLQSFGFDPQAASFDGAIPSTPVTLTVADGTATPRDYTVTLKEVSRSRTARYLAASGDCQATSDRPIQPRLVIDLGRVGTNPVKAASISSGTYTDYAGFNPAISRWTNEWEVGPIEFQVATKGWWPASPVTLSTIDTPRGREQRLIVLLAQFRPTSAAGQTVTGIERVWRDLQVTLFRGPGTDVIAPTVRSVKLSMSEGMVTGKVDASDSSGISRITATRFGTLGATPFSFASSDWTHVPGGTYDVTFAAPGVQLGDLALSVSVMDGAGNVTTMTAKGALVPSVTHTLSATTTGSGGSISPAGSVTVTDGASQTFTISPDAQHHVADVVVDGVSRGALTSYTFSNVTGDHTLAASFAVDQAVLTVATVGSGSVARSPDQVSYAYGSPVQLTASADPGWQFAGWSGDASGTANPLTVTMAGDQAVTATFTRVTHTLTASAGPGGAIDPSGAVAVDEGADRSFTITPDPHHHLVELLLDGEAVSVGDNGDGSFSYTLTAVNADHSLAAVFAIDQAVLTVATVGSGSVARAPDQASYAYGSPVQLTASADPGWQFAGWSGDASGTANPLTVTMAGDQAVTATFTRVTHTLTASAGPGGAIDPSGAVAVDEGADRSFTITPDPHHHLVELLLDGEAVSVGDNGDGSFSYTLTAVNADHSLAAVFAIDQAVLTVATVGSGSVARAPDQVSYAYGSPVQLTASADPGWQFAGWSGDASGTANPLTVTMAGDKTIAASFTEVLQVTTYAGTAGDPGNSDGTGSAARFSGPVGVACDADGNVYVADMNNNTIRKITPAGAVSTLAGSATGDPGNSDGTGSAARFSGPVGVACDADGNVYVADMNNNTIRKITPAGAVSTLAGSATGDPGNSDGTGSAARFSGPVGVACDADGNVYVADMNNNTIRKITPAGAVSTLAGSATGDPGNSDGTGSAARFSGPVGVACDADGNVYVADMNNNTIRKITPAGAVSTLAGSATGDPGNSDGTGSAARFSGPVGVACDADGNVYVADMNNNTIRETSFVGVVRTIAGTAELPGSGDGIGGAAGFNNPMGVACDADGNVYVADTGNDTIRRAVPASTVGGVISVRQNSGGTIALSGQTGAPAQVVVQPGTDQAFTITADAHYRVADVLVDNVSVGPLASYTFTNVTQDHSIRAIFADNTFTLTYTAGLHGSITGTTPQTVDRGADGTPVTATPELGYHFTGWSDGVATATRTDVNVTADLNLTASFAVNQVGLTAGATGQGAVTIIPDLPTYAYGSPVQLTAHAAPGWQFTNWGGDASGSDNPLTVTMNGDKNVTAFFAEALQVMTLAGSAGDSGSVDGTGSAARFYHPMGVACDSLGNVYVAEYANHTIRKMTADGAVTTLAGSAGSYGSADGAGSTARFRNPEGLASDAGGNLYVADTFNFTIRKITPAGVVSTLAGLALNSGSVDGVGDEARFVGPSSIACDGAGNLYVTDGDSTIRKVTPAGEVTTLAGLAGNPGYADGIGSQARFYYPLGIACDAAGNVYVGDRNNYAVRMITPGGTVTTLAGSPGHYGSIDGSGSLARFEQPAGIACDADGNLFVTDSAANAIRRVTPEGVVTTVAGSGTSGSADGAGSTARFLAPVGVACDAAGNVYVADYGNHTIRRGVLPSTAGGFLNVTQSGGGTIALSGQTGAAPARIGVQHGNDKTLTITPDSHYHVVDVIVDGASQGALTSYTFSVVTADHTITASFSVDSFTLAYTAGAHGSISGTSPQSVDYGGDGSPVTAVPEAGYHFVAWSDGVLTATRTDTNVTANLSVTASFAVDDTTPPEVTITSPVDGKTYWHGVSMPLRVTATDAGSGVDTTAALNDGSSISVGTSVSTTAGNHALSVTVTDIAGNSTTATCNYSATDVEPAYEHVGTLNLSYSGGDPQGIAVDGAGTVYAPIGNDNRIARVNAAGVSLGTITYPIVFWSQASGVAFAPDGSGPLWVTDRYYEKAVALNPATGGTPLATITDSAFTGLGHIAVDSAGSVYALNSANADNYVIKFVRNGDGTYTRQLTMSPTENSLRSLSVDEEGCTYVTSSTAQRVIKFDPSGARTGSWAAPEAIGIDTDDVGLVYVSDNGSRSDAQKCIRVYTSDGTPITTFGNPPFGSFKEPSSITVGPDGKTIYVLEPRNKLVQVFKRVPRVPHTIIASAGTGGSITPSGATSVPYGADRSFTIAADLGYQISDVKVDGTSVGAIGSYEFTNVTAPHTIEATFLKIHDITASAGPGGSITPSGDVTVVHGGSQTFTVIPDPHHHIDRLLLGGASVTPTDSGNGSFSYTVSDVHADTTLEVTFAIDTFTLEYAAGPGGSITGDMSQTVDYGASGSEVTAVPDAGYHFMSWSDGSTANPRTDRDVTAAVTVTAQFEADAPTGTMTLNGGVPTTYSALVGLDSSGVSGATDMRTSTDGKATWSDWQPLAAESVIALPASTGTKTVWVQYRNGPSSALERSASVTLAVSPIEAGCNFSLTVAADGSLRTWGNNESGQIGDGTTSVKRSIPTYVSSSSVWNTVSGGVQHTLGVKSDGSLWAWGDNAYGQLGIGLVGNKTTPTPVGGATDWASVSAGYIHSLALKTDRTLWAWGDNYYGELGDGTNTNSSTPQQIGVGNWKAVSTGYLFNLAIRSDGTLWAWGDNSDGQIGNGTKTNVNHPVQISGEGTWAAVSAGNWHSLALKNDGTLWAWGRGGNYQLGDGTNVEKLTPTQIGTGHDWVAVSAGGSRSFALKADGALWGWGYPQLGDGTDLTSTEPKQIGNGQAWVAISAGQQHCLALKRDGTLWAWGANANGQVGDGIFTNSGPMLRLDPVKIINLTDPTPPTVNITAPADASTVTSATPQLQLDVSVDAETTEIWVDDLAVPDKVSGDQLDALADGQHRVMVRVRNALGNFAVATSTFTVAVPPPPQGSMTLNGGEATTYNTMAAIDSTGIAYATQMRTSTDGTSWSDWRDIADHSVVALPGLPGTTTVYVRYRNAAGQALERQADVTRRAVPVAAGAQHDLALHAGGKLYAWGGNIYGSNYHGEFGDGTTQSRAAPGRIGSGTDWAQICAGDSHTAAVKADGTLWTWGSDQHGQLGNGSEATESQSTPAPVGTIKLLGIVKQDDVDVVTLIVNGTTYAAIRVGETVPASNWGQVEVLGIDALARTVAIRLGVQQHTLEEGQTLLDDSWAMVSAGSLHTLAIKQDGSLWTWGRNGSGQLGDGSTTDRHHPVQIGSDKDWAAAAAGVDFSLALKADGRLYAWGQNSAGQLGLGNYEWPSTPTHVGSDNDWLAIAASGSHALALKADGEMYGWGSNPNGEVGCGGNENQRSPVAIGAGHVWTQIAAGPYNGFAVTDDGRLWSWGQNSGGQLGDGTQNTQRSPVPVSGTGWLAVAASNNHALGYKSDGRVWTWGGDACAGDGTTANRLSPVRVGGNAPWMAVASGRYWTLALDAEGGLWSWGYNATTGLGDGYDGYRSAPVRIGTDVWSKITAGFDYRLAIKSDGTLWACGNNNIGQLGDGTQATRTTPVQIGTENDWAGISAGWDHTLALKTDGTLYAWGDNGWGQLGVPAAGSWSSAAVLVPSPVAGRRWAAMAAAEGHSLGLLDDGSLWAWGRNVWGDLGDGTTASRNAPVRVGNPAWTWKAIAANGFHNLAIRSDGAFDGTLWGWGDNGYGQVGDGTTNSPVTAPVQIGSASDWAAIGCGRNHSLAVKANDEVYAWGYNGNGQLGDATTDNRLSPVLVATGGVAVSGGEANSAVLAADGTISACGQGSSGVLGDGSMAHRLTFMPVFNLW